MVFASAYVYGLHAGGSSHVLRNPLGAHTNFVYVSDIKNGCAMVETRMDLVELENEETVRVWIFVGHNSLETLNVIDCDNTLRLRIRDILQACRSLHLLPLSFRGLGTIKRHDDFNTTDVFEEFE